MSRLLVHVECETEESFVNEVLAPHLYEPTAVRIAVGAVKSTSDEVITVFRVFHMVQRWFSELNGLVRIGSEKGDPQ